MSRGKYEKITYNTVGTKDEILLTPNFRAVVAIQASSDASYTIEQAIVEEGDFVADATLINLAGNFVNGLHSNIAKLRLVIANLGTSGEIIFEYKLVDAI